MVLKDAKTARMMSMHLRSRRLKENQVEELDVEGAAVQDAEVDDCIRIANPAVHRMLVVDVLLSLSLVTTMGLSTNNLEVDVDLDDG